MGNWRFKGAVDCDYFAVRDYMPHFPRQWNQLSLTYKQTVTREIMISKLNFWQRIFLYLSVPWAALWIAKLTVESQNPEGSGDTSGQLMKAVLIPAVVYMVGLGIAEIRAAIARRKKQNERHRSRHR